MKPLLFGVLCSVAFVCGLRAQDVTITPLAWKDPSGAPDELPRPDKMEPVEFPASLSSTTDIGYVVVSLTLSEKGKVLHLQARGTLPQYRSAYWNTLNRPHTFIAGRRDGKGVNAEITFAIIFNPSTAATNLQDSSPRLLETAMATRAMPTSDKKAPSIPDEVVEADVTVGENGLVSGIANAPKSVEKLLIIAAKNWKFAPARRNGNPVMATIRMPFIIVTDRSDGSVKSRIPPRPVAQAQPVYPLLLRMTGQTGEVLVGFDVTVEGRVKNAHVIRSLNHSFDMPALVAVRQWRFQPGTEDGRPVSMSSSVPIVFILNGESSDGPMETVKKGDSSKLPPEFRYDTPPRMTVSALPVYPYAALWDQRDGKAVVQYVVSQEGNVVSSSLREATTPEFGAAVLAAVDAFKYEPAVRAGKPTATLLAYEQEFSITKDWSLSSRQDAELLALERKKSPRIVKLSDLDEPLAPTYQQPGIFPTSVANSISSGKAVVEFLVDDEGNVCLPRVISASAPEFGFAAVHSVAGWYFEVPKHGGKPVVVRVRVPFEFSRAPAEKP
ncbi:MAG: TonB family protein [Verrucomicrobia bacterium]|nr:TonB family protein [Verrucomicrobiota bacterium]